MSELQLESVFSSKGRTKILGFLISKKETNLTNIIKNTGLNYTSVVNHLQYLEKIDFIQEKTYGRIKIYRFKQENLYAKALENLVAFWEGKI